MYVINREAFVTYQGINFFERHLRVWGLAPEKFSRITLSRESEMPFCVAGKDVFIIDLHFGMESITSISNQFCTNMEDKTLILKVEILLLASLVRQV